MLLKNINIIYMSLYNNIHPTILRNNFAIAPNVPTIESYKWFGAQLQTGFDNGLQLFETKKQDTNLQKDMKSYVEYYEPIAIKQQQIDEHKNCLLGKLETFYDENIKDKISGKLGIDISMNNMLIA